jgi:Domain of unknown function (DUF4271)
MLPQSIIADSTKKGIDKLPFAPFLNKEKIEQLKQSSAADTTKKKNKKKQEQTVVKQQEKQEGIVKIKLPKTDSIQTLIKNQATTFQPISATGSDTNNKPESDSSQNVITANEFMFSDDTTIVASDYNSSSYFNSTIYFKGHLLKSAESTPHEINKSVPDWFTIVLLLMIAGITAIKILYRKIFSQMVAAFYSLAVTNQIVRDENMLVQRATVLLNIIFYGVGALFLYQLSILFNWNHPFLNEGIFRFFLFAILIACFYSTKLIVLKLLSFIFEIDKPVFTYIFSVFLINNSVGLLLTPLVALFVYVAFAKSIVVIYICLAIVALAFIFRMWRALTISLLLPRFSLYYLFLYFCTLEIAPVLIILKTTGNLG